MELWWWDPALLEKEILHRPGREAAEKSKLPQNQRTYVLARDAGWLNTVSREVNLTLAPDDQTLDASRSASFRR